MPKERIALVVQQQMNTRWKRASLSSILKPINAYSPLCNFHQHPHGTLLTRPAPSALAPAASDQYQQNYNETPPGFGEQASPEHVPQFCDGHKAPMMMLLQRLHAKDDDAEPMDRMKTVHTWLHSADDTILSASKPGVIVNHGHRTWTKQIWTPQNTSKLPGFQILLSYSWWSYNSRTT